MTFEEILDQAIAMLQRRGRVSYRALQRQFQLDDAYLQDLTAEIVEVLQVAVDHDHAILVWTGGPSAPAPLAPPPPSPPSLDTQERPPPPRASVPSAQYTPEAERRQLTVMFCDLVDSTRLSAQLDPEDLREVVRAYQTTCAAVIQRFDGHIAQYLGDGLLVYFGYPQAHEDDAQRAVRAGLGMIETMDTLNRRLRQRQGVHLAVRIGIHTGLVVVGEMGGGGRQEQLALGETPNIAARLQGLAAPDTLVISEATAHLVEGYFLCEALGMQALKGLAAPLRVSRVLHASETQTRLDVAAVRGLTPLVGREADVTVLRERWAQVKEGLGQVVLLNGEPGIGKSRLVQELRQATQQFCAEKSTDNLRTLLDLRGKMQARTCSLWVQSYDKDFTLRGTEWVSTQVPSGPCGIMETAVLSSTLYDSHGQAIRFNRYQTRHRVTKKQAPRCTAGEDKDYVLVLEKPRYTECMYIDFSPQPFGWSVWQPTAP